MYISQQQEEFCRAYVYAVVAAAGLRSGKPEPDDDSVDLTISSRGLNGTRRSPKLDLQLKCQLGGQIAEDPWPYDLKAKNYEDLRHTDYQVPRILVVVRVPENVEDWLDQDEERLLLKHCGWWVSLHGMAESQNSSTIRVKIPRTQIFDVSGLSGIMSRIGRGELP
ncbi:DUF4365 domain-containing protein [Microvenator marinus]|uniref:DUF4365 domain-containing protein n=2 Tax=Microvenator marinus TaxID=2600177 RepID=A0A5B8XWN0_9DELT|nr:DUF4365 domain-containing protein [Microvenator marinus]